jgi:hypothetical protein
MKRRFAGLHETGAANEVPDGVFLVRVEKAEYWWHAQKPFYILQLSVLEPKELAGRIISGRLYCTSKALWKLGCEISSTTRTCSVARKLMRKHCLAFAASLRSATRLSTADLS